MALLILFQCWWMCRFWKHAPPYRNEQTLTVTPAHKVLRAVMQLQKHVCQNSTGIATNQAVHDLLLRLHPELQQSTVHLTGQLLPQGFEALLTTLQEALTECSPRVSTTSRLDPLWPYCEA